MAEVDPEWASIEARAWIERHLWIRTKDKRVVPLRFNPIQEAYWQARTNRDLILKYRQGGVSTLILAEFFEDTARHEHTVSVVVAHDAESTERLFQIVQRYYDMLPEAEKARLCARPEKPQYKNRRELYFDRVDSWFIVGTAGNLNFGRSQTINNLHASEVAFWPDPEELMTGLLEAVPDDGRVREESTANGFGTWHHKEWQRSKAGESRFKPHFFEWWIHTDYRLPLEPGERVEYTDEERALTARANLTPEQIKWRREKIKDLEDKFPQEYPEDPVTCFLTSGRPYFDRQKLMGITIRPGERYTIDEVNGQVTPDPAGELEVWRLPQPGQIYVVGADVAEGLEKGDYSCGEVMDWGTCEQVAELHGHFDVDVFARKLHVLSAWYGWALLGVERNNHGHAVNNVLLNYTRYPNLYRHQEWDDEDKAKDPDDLPPGWPTNQKTRPVMLADLKAGVRGDWLRINGEGLRGECLSFVVNAKGKPEADLGCFDDRVLATAIALQLRKFTGPIDAGVAARERETARQDF